MSHHFQRLTAFLCAAVLAAPLSFAAESRTPQRTDLRQLATELERALGKGHVDVEGTAAGAGSATRETTRRAPVETIALVDAMNRERVARGLKPLRLNDALDDAAQDRVADMFRQHYFAHVAPDGTQPFVWVDRHGYRYTIVGENLATGYGTAASVVNGWMNSPGHRANLLGREFDDVGVAIGHGSPARPYAGPLVVAIYAAR